MRLKSWRVKKIPCAQSRLLAHSGPLPVALCQCQCHTIDTNHTKLTMVKLCNIFGQQANFSLNEYTNQEMQFEGDKWLEKWNQFKISEGQKYETSLPDCFLRRMLHKGRKVDHCTNFITFNIFAWMCKGRNPLKKSGIWWEVLYDGDSPPPSCNNILVPLFTIHSGCFWRILWK